MTFREPSAETHEQRASEIRVKWRRESEDGLLTEQQWNQAYQDATASLLDDINQMLREITQRNGPYVTTAPSPDPRDKVIEAAREFAEARDAWDHDTPNAEVAEVRYEASKDALHEALSDLDRTQGGGGG